MPTFAPFAAPLITGTQPTALTIASLLANAGWTNSYCPTSYNHDHIRPSARRDTVDAACRCPDSCRPSSAATGDASPGRSSRAAPTPPAHLRRTPL